MIQNHASIKLERYDLEDRRQFCNVVPISTIPESYNLVGPATITLADGTEISLSVEPDMTASGLTFRSAYERQPLRDAIFDWGAQNDIVLNEDMINDLLIQIQHFLKTLDSEWDVAISRRTRGD